MRKRLKRFYFKEGLDGREFPSNTLVGGIRRNAIPYNTPLRRVKRNVIPYNTNANLLMCSVELIVGL
jgi:hypothetical protein